MLHSFAQNLEDVVLWRVLGGVENGTYVDVGAADPEVDSVTKLFYERGWSGLNVEPVAELAERLRSQRDRDITIESCAGATEGTVVLHRVAGTGLSTVDEQVVASLGNAHVVDDIVVPVERLDDMLLRHGFESRPIHFMKIDVEGYEREVLEGIDLEAWRPWVLVVESTSPQSVVQTHERWELLVTSHRYRFCLFDGLNRFYIAAEHDDLAASLSYPACVFDQPFVQSTFAESGFAYEQLEIKYQSAVDSYESLQGELRSTVGAYDDLHGRYQALLESYQRLEETYREVIASYELQAGELARTVSSYEVQGREVERLTKTNGELTDECATLRHGVVEMADGIDELRQALRQREAQIAQAEAALDQITNSTSWRLTRPVRNLADVAKRSGRNTAP